MQAIDCDLYKSVCGGAASVFLCKLVFHNQPSLNGWTYVDRFSV